MGKRATVVLSSSSSDDEGFSKSSLSNFKKPKPKPKAVSAPRSNPNKGSKKARISGSRSHPGKNANPFEEMKLFCEDFGEGFSGFKAIEGTTKNHGWTSINLVLWWNYVFIKRRSKRLKFGLKKE